MNKLYARIDFESTLTFKTKETDAWRAWDEMMHRMGTVGIDTTDFTPDELKLYDEDGEAIDHWVI